MIDLTNNIYGELTVLGLHHKDSRRKLYWLCECSCGETVIKRGDFLKSGKHPSCGCYKFESGVKVNRIGLKYSRLTVLEETEQRDASGSIKYLCSCECGNTSIVSGNNLQSGDIKSCGCLSTEQRRKQGKANAGANNGMYGKFRELHPNWKGEEHRTENDRLRKSDEYKKWRNLVFERDNYTCQKCGKHGEKLNAHHLYSFAKYPEKRFDIDNGVTLCIECHREEHHINGRVTHGETIL